MAGVGGAHAAQRSCSGTRGMRQQGSCRQAMHQSPCKGPRARQVGATAIVDFGRVGVGSVARCNAPTTPTDSL